MKKLLTSVFLAVLFVFTASADAGKKHFFDRFELPVKRTVWFKIGTPKENWTRNFKLTAFGTRW